MIWPFNTAGLDEPLQWGSALDKPAKKTICDFFDVETMLVSRCPRFCCFLIFTIPIFALHLPITLNGLSLDPVSYLNTSRPAVNATDSNGVEYHCNHALGQWNTFESCRDAYERIPSSDRVLSFGERSAAGHFDVPLPLLYSSCKHYSVDAAICISLLICLMPPSRCTVYILHTQQGSDHSGSREDERFLVDGVIHSAELYL